MAGIAAGPGIGVVVPPRHDGRAGRASAVGGTPPLCCSAVLAVSVAAARPGEPGAGVLASCVAIATAERNRSASSGSSAAVSPGGATTTTSEPRTRTRSGRSRPATSRHVTVHCRLFIVGHRRARCSYSVPVDTPAARTNTAQRAESVGIAKRRASRIAGRASSTPIVSESLFRLSSRCQPCTPPEAAYDRHPLTIRCARQEVPAAG